MNQSLPNNVLVDSNNKDHGISSRQYHPIRIDDIKKEKIAFIIDLYDELKHEDFVTVTNDKKENRFNIITSEIANFVKVKDYFSSETEYALYTYGNTLKQEIKFNNISSFLEQFSEFKLNILNNTLSQGHDRIDLAMIFDEAHTYLKQSLSVEAFSKSKSSENDTIIRFILFYVRSDVPVVLSKPHEYNLMTFVRLTNFVFDVVFMRKKSSSDEAKKSMMTTFNSLKTAQAPFWYSLEVSGSVQKFKHYMNLLLANPNQRIKLSEIDKQQKKVEELIKNFSQDN